MELLQALSKVYDQEVKVIDHQTGFRPTTHDRKPVLGFHPEYPQLGVFNGFGSRGVLLIPYFAQHIQAHIELQSNLNNEVNLMRYWKKEKRGAVN